VLLEVGTARPILAADVGRVGFAGLAVGGTPETDLRHAVVFETLCNWVQTRAVAALWLHLPLPAGVDDWKRLLRHCRRLFALAVRCGLPVAASGPADLAFAGEDGPSPFCGPTVRRHRVDRVAFGGARGHWEIRAAHFALTLPAAGRSCGRCLGAGIPHALARTLGAQWIDEVARRKMAVLSNLLSW